MWCMPNGLLLLDSDTIVVVGSAVVEWFKAEDITCDVVRIVVVGLLRLLD